MEIHPSVFIASLSYVSGELKIGQGSSVWPNATIRADSFISVGKYTNIQDNAVLHSQGEERIKVGDKVTIGHSAIVHGAEVEHQCLIGMNAVILNRAKIGRNSIIGASALVTEEKEIPPRSLALGAPAKVIRKITDEEIEQIKENAQEYYQMAQKYKNQDR